MTSLLFFLTLAFVIINIVQTWLVFRLKSLIKGGIIIGFLEAIEFFLMIYLFLIKELVIFSILIVIETVQWLTIAYLATKD